MTFKYQYLIKPVVPESLLGKADGKSKDQSLFGITLPSLWSSGNPRTYVGLGFCSAGSRGCCHKLDSTICPALWHFLNQPFAACPSQPVPQLMSNFATLQLAPESPSHTVASKARAWCVPCLWHHTAASYKSSPHQKAAFEPTPPFSSLELKYKIVLTAPWW